MPLANNQWSVAIITAANQGIINNIDSHATLPGYTEIRDAGGVVLSKCIYTDPCGTINGTTGQLTITHSGRDDAADATGTAASAHFMDGAGVEHHRLPCQAGTGYVAGFYTLVSLNITAGQPIEYNNITV